MTAYLKRMPIGIPGTISRAASQATIEQLFFDKDAKYSGYGIPLKLDGDRAVPLTSASEKVCGILVRPYPTTSALNQLGVSIPNLQQVADILRRGYITVRVVGGTPKKQDQVYIDATTFGFTAVSTGNTALSGAFFTGEAMDDVAEIEFNI